MSYMLQSDALLPWLSVLDNACLGLKLEKNLTEENVIYVKELIKKFGLESFMNQKPNNLSTFVLKMKFFFHFFLRQKWILF